jgi:hypothetical protein
MWFLARSFHPPEFQDLDQRDASKSRSGVSASLNLLLELLLEGAGHINP